MAIEGPRAMKPEEFRSGVELADRVFRQGRLSSRTDAYPLLWREDNLQNLRVFADDGKVVSLIGMQQRDICLLGSRHRSCCLGSVCTEPDYRGQGLATRLLHDCRDKALDDGVAIFLISGRRGLYRRQGYVDVGSYHICTVKRSRLPENKRYSLRPWRPEDVPAMLGIYSAEPVRFARSPEDMLAVLRIEIVPDAPGATRVVCPRGTDEPVAYISYRVGPGSTKDEDAVTVAEVAGPRWAIAQVLGELLDERGVDSLALPYLDCDGEMAELARSFGWPTKPRGFRGTVGIIDPARFWQACAALFAERLGGRRAGRLGLSASGAVRLTYGDEELALEGISGITELIFLPPHRRKELELGLGADSQLARLLDGLFPLPLVDYGLNHV